MVIDRVAFMILAAFHCSGAMHWILLTEEPSCLSCSMVSDVARLLWEAAVTLTSRVQPSPNPVDLKCHGMSGDIWHHGMAHCFLSMTIHRRRYNFASKNHLLLARTGPSCQHYLQPRAEPAAPILLDYVFSLCKTTRGQESSQLAFDVGCRPW